MTEKLAEHLVELELAQVKRALFIFRTVAEHPAASPTFLEDNDKSVTKHMGQAMLGW